MKSKSICVPRTVAESTCGLAVVNAVRRSRIPVPVSARSFARSSAVVSSSSSVGTSSSVVVSCPAVSGSLACPASPVRPSPVVAPPVQAGSVLSGPAGSGSTVVSPARPTPVAVPPVWPRLLRARTPLIGRLGCSPFVPVVYFVMVAVPVLLFSPFGLVWSFLPTLR